MGGCVALEVPVPGILAFRCTTTVLRAGVNEHYTVGRIDRGRTERWSRGKSWRGTAGAIELYEPGDVHRDLAHDGPTTFTGILLPASDVDRVRAKGRVLAVTHLEATDERAAPFHRLHEAVNGGAGRLAIEVAVAEAVGAFTSLDTKRTDHTQPVRRAVELLRARYAEVLTLDEIATHSGLDKFHLCRAFRAQVGMPPHRYLTHLRIERARELLAKGVRASALAPHVGFYDQAQLTRHFRRVVGVTPGKYSST